jgi:hypothetical protein
MRWKAGSPRGARIARIDPGTRPRQDGTSPTRQAQVQRRPRSDNGPRVRGRGRSELARPVRRDGITWASPRVIDNFPQEIPITRREIDVIETYLGVLLDDTLESRTSTQS